MVLKKIRQVVIGMDVIVSILLIGLSYALMPVFPLGYFLLGVVDAVDNRFYDMTQTEFFIGVVLFTYGLAVIVGLLAPGVRHLFNIRSPGRTPLSDVAVPLAILLSLPGLLAILTGVYYVIFAGLLNPVTFAYGGVFLLFSAGLLRYTSNYASNRNAETTGQPAQ